MKKYKLIKEYPGSPKLGTVAEYFKSDLEHRGYCYRYKESSEFYLSIHSYLVENYPKFWEEIIEKVYEILSFIGSKSKNIITMAQNSNIEEYFNDKNLYIYSVRRLSDGEVFTVGDKFVNPYGSKEVEQIEYFEIVDGYLLVRMYHTVTKGSSTYQFINNVSKNIFDYRYKEPLFTTEDGVDIFNKTDNFVWVNKCTFGLEKRIIDNQRHNFFFVYEPHKELYFSTKEAAEEYILMNKPCLSINDINNSLGEWSGIGMVSLTLDQMKKLVKSKL